MSISIKPDGNSQLYEAYPIKLSPRKTATNSLKLSYTRDEIPFAAEITEKLPFWRGNLLTSTSLTPIPLLARGNPIRIEEASEEPAVPLCFHR